MLDSHIDAGGANVFTAQLYSDETAFLNEKIHDYLQEANNAFEELYGDFSCGLDLMQLELVCPP